MIRKLNYTNRQKISLENIEISFVNHDKRTFFNAVLKKDGLEFPDNARVFIEPYYGPDFLRFDFGSFKTIEQPANTDISELKELSDKIFFRIKIVDETKEDGLILGFANVRNFNDDNAPAGKESILFVNAIKMETNEIWRMNFNTEDSIPILEINNSIEGIREIAKSDPLFVGLVYPSAIRQIFEKIIELNDFDSQGDSWNSKWILFSHSVLGITNTPADNEDKQQCDNWVNAVVKSFCIRNKILENYSKKINA